MKIGFHLCEPLIDSDPSGIRGYAVLAEELGVDHITCVDHVLGPSAKTGTRHSQRMAFTPRKANSTTP